MAAKQNCGRVCKTFRLIKSVVTIPEIRNLYVTLYKFSTRQRTVNLSFFIARRMAQPAPGNKPGVMERIAVVSVALGMAVMILAMAVIMGFGISENCRLPMENGSVWYFPLRTRSSSLSRKDLHTDSWYFPSMRNLFTNVLISIIQTMKAA